jgi:hypothetical protein
MKRVINKLHELLDKAYVTNWLGVILFLTLLLRIPSFFEPYYYGDEMIYLNLGEGVRQGQVLYKEIFDNKPPLIYLTAAAAGSLFWFKVILAFWNIATIVIFWNLARILFEKNERLQKIATVFFALLTTLPTLEGHIVNAELFMIGPSLLAFFFLLGKGVTPKKIFVSGLLFGVASLFKIPAAFDIPVILTYWVIVKGFKNWKETVKDTIILSLGFATPILLSFDFYFFQGGLPEYLKAAFFQNVGYIESWQVKVPMAMRVGVVALGTLIIYLFRKKLTNKFILICLWTLFSLFAVILSQRPYPHYLIQSAAPLALLIGMLLAQKSIEQSLSVIPLTLIIFVPFYYHFYDYKIVPYYSRFISFATGRVSRGVYFNNFSPNTNRNYEIATFLANSSVSSDRVFVWDEDAPAIYALSRRIPPLKYVAPYHVNDYSNRDEVAQILAETKPKFIVTTSNFTFPEILGLLRSKYLLISQIENAEIWSRISE